jgi:xanthine dehydrogenase accessory factor
MAALDLQTALTMALQLQERGRSAVVVAVVAARSGCPVVPGGRVVVEEDGALSGSIDRRLDPLIAQEAMRSLTSRRSRMQSYVLLGDVAEAAPLQRGDVDLFFEVLARAPHLVIVGAGHIAMPLARLGKMLEFEVTVLDDRPEYANRERFPDVDTVLVGPYRPTIAGVEVTPDTYIVLVTRGHVHDQACLEQVIDSGAAYLGMIGSKSRVRTVIEHARENGYAGEKLRRIHAPIGLDIGAQTPAEIALAIAAEIVSVRRSGRARSLARGVGGGD